jgi:transcriptional regulator with XRE-family HTH domain
MSKRNPFDENRILLRMLLTQVRIEQKITQKELAERLQKPQSFVSKYENGERILDLIELCEICISMRIDFIVFIKRFYDKTLFKLQ